MAPNACTYCNTTNTTTRPLKPCTNCKAAAYCDRKCQKAHFKAHKSVCREQKIAADRAAKDAVAQLKTARDEEAEQLAADFGQATLGEPMRRQLVVFDDLDDEGNLRSIDEHGREKVMPALTFVMRDVAASRYAPEGATEVIPFPDHVVEAMAHMSKAEKLAYHAKIESSLRQRAVGEAGEGDYEIFQRFEREIRARKAVECEGEKAKGKERQ